MASLAAPPSPLALVTPPPAGVGPQPLKWTREQYYKLGESGFFQGKRVELIHGEIIQMSPIGWPHSLSTGLVAECLARIFAGTHWVSEQQPFRVQVSTDVSEPEPNVAVIPGSRRTYTDHPTLAALIVEVSDTTLFFDTTTKAELYATANVSEYWVLDLEHRQLHVLRDPEPLPTGLGATAYRTRTTLNTTQTVSPLEAPNSTITVSDLLP